MGGDVPGQEGLPPRVGDTGPDDASGSESVGPEPGFSTVHRVTVLGPHPFPTQRSSPTFLALTWQVGVDEGAQRQNQIEAAGIPLRARQRPGHP